MLPPRIRGRFWDEAAQSVCELGDILPRLQSWASHAQEKGGSLVSSGVRSDEPVGVPRPRYSYVAWDSEVSCCFASVCAPEGLRFDAAGTESTASFRGVETRRAIVATTTLYTCVGHSTLPILAGGGLCGDSSHQRTGGFSRLIPIIKICQDERKFWPSLRSRWARIRSTGSRAAESDIEGPADGVSVGRRLYTCPIHARSLVRRFRYIRTQCGFEKMDTASVPLTPAESDRES